MLGLSTPNYCRQCGAALKPNSQFCPVCGKAVTHVTPPQNGQVVTQTTTRRSSGIGIAIVVVLILLVLIVPVFPRDRVVYVDGFTQTVTAPSSYNTAIQTFTTPTKMQVSVYQGSLQYIPAQYYSVFYDYPNYYYNYYPYSYPYRYYSCSYYYCPFYSYSYPINYGYSYATTVIIQPSDNIVRVQQSPESNGYGVRLNLTHYDGTSITYAYVIQQNLSQTGTTIVQGVATNTNTITNSIVNPVPATVPCRQCVPQHVTDHVSILQLILGF